MLGCLLLAACGSTTKIERPSTDVGDIYSRTWSRWAWIGEIAGAGDQAGLAAAVETESLGTAGKFELPSMASLHPCCYRFDCR